MVLTELIRNSAKINPRGLAVIDPDGSITYSELDMLANRLAGAFIKLGVQAGDRVGIWINKSIKAVAAMQGVLRVGAVYVPLDPQAPPSRIKTIIKDCEMHVLVSSHDRIATIRDEICDLSVVYIDSKKQQDEICWNDLESFPDIFSSPHANENDMAYILYTSGSTGIPKGVCISHLNALAFIRWAAQILKADSSDRFSNHAPFHFDLSVLDLYVPFLVGASVSIIPDGVSYMPRKLIDFILKEKITIWYSVPSVLILMMDEGDFLEIQNNPIRVIIFAGEPFPVKHLRRLVKKWPSLRYINMYGPTETNVCTFYEVDDIEEDRTKPVAIGKACSDDKVWAVNGDGKEVNINEEGELLVSGPTVMLGYWGKERHGNKPYATGDLVRQLENGDYEYIGRKDHMVKIRGHRIELGDIEAALCEHKKIHEVAVIAAGSGLEARLVAFIVTKNSSQPSILELKKHCAERLPRYMIIDKARFLEAIPRTRNGKIDRLRLQSEHINKSI
jgi:L-proline---[L-prolyl-carrier protein] ligase